MYCSTITGCHRKTAACHVTNPSMCYNYCFTVLNSTYAMLLCMPLTNKVSSSSSSLGSRCVPWLGEGLSMPPPCYPVLCCPLPDRVAPVFVQVVSPQLGCSPLSSFLVIWSPSGDTRGPSVVFEAVDMPCPGPFHFSCILMLSKRWRK